MTRSYGYGGLFILLGCLGTFAEAANPPEWAVMECRGLKAWQEAVYYWIDRQNEDGSFGFGLDDDCEFYETWPILVMAADDQRIVESLNKAVEWAWHHDSMQLGFLGGARDSAHAGEIPTGTVALLSTIDYGNPIMIERLMQTSKHIEQWTGITPQGHRHFRSNFFGSLEMYEHAYYGTDATVNGRVAIPMIHLLWYNRDPDLAKYIVEWGRAWIAQAKSTALGKPYGLLPAEVVFKTGEPCGFTKNWAIGAVIYYSQRFQLHQVLIMCYLITGDADFLLPARAEMSFFGEARQGRVPDGHGIRVGQGRRSNLEVQAPNGKWEDLGYSRVGDELIQFYRAATDDKTYNRWWGSLKPMSRKDALEAGREAIKLATEKMEEAKKINIDDLGGVANYEASLDDIGRGFPLLYYGVDNMSLDPSSFPRPVVRWLKGDYELAVVLLENSRTGLKALCCNVGEKTREFGAQFFNLRPGTYHLTLGIDTNGDDRPDKIVREENVGIERGSKVFFDLERGHEYVLELRQVAQWAEWEPRADVAVSSRSIFARPAAPPPGSQAELEIRVHNIGTLDATAVDVWVEELGTGKFIGQKTIEIIPRPKQMVPSNVSVLLPWTVSPEAKGVRVRVDSGNLIREIYEGNNEAEIALEAIPEGPPKKRFIFIPQWYLDAQKGPVPEFTATYVEGITIDGRLDDPAWRKVQRIGPLLCLDQSPSDKPTYVRLAYGKDAFYVAIECEEPRMDLLKTKAKEHDDGMLFVDDAFEIFIDSNHDKLTYTQFVANSAGILAEGQYHNFSLYNDPWECKVRREKDRYIGEFRIPFASVQANPKPGDKWGVAVYRTAFTFTPPEDEEARKKGWKDGERTALSPVFAGFHQPGRVAVVTCGPKP